MANNGVGRVGIRSYVAAPTQQITSSTLLTSLYSVWNADTTGTSLDSNIYGAWNGESLGTSLDTGIYGVWNGDNNANDSVGLNNGTLVNGTTFTIGKLGTSSFSFDGVNDYVTLPSSGLRFTGDFTISSWFYMNTQSTYNALVQNFYSTDFSNRYGWALYYQGGKIRFATYNLSTAITQGSTTIATGQWYHLVVTKTVSGTPKIYINGVLESSTVAYGTNTLHPAYNTNNIPRFGVDVDSGIWGGYLNGKLDAITTWSKELTHAEVNNLYNGGTGVQYPFSSQTLLSTNDSFSTNHGTLMNGCTYTTGKIGNAFSFDGINDYITLADNSLNLTDNFSISFWSYFNNVTNSQIILSSYMIGGSKTVAGIFIELAASQFRFRGYNNGSMVLNTTVSAPTIGVWEHYVWTKDSNASKVYKNGVLVGTDSNAHGNPNYETISYSLIGANRYNSTTYQEYFNGKLDSMSIWNKVLNVDEVTQLYNTGNGTQYPFSSQTLPSSANQLGVDNGTLMNGCTFTDGKIGKAFLFDGVNDYVSFPNNILSFDGDFSISMWVYFNSLNQPNSQWNQQFIFSNNSSVGSYGFSLYKHSNNSLYFIISNSSSSSFFRAPQTLSQSTWYHVVITRKFGTTTKIYINGTEQTDAYYYSGNSSINPSYSTNQIVNLSGWNNAGGDLLNGKIDAFSAWSKTLTHAEVTELYNSGNGKQLTVDTKIVTTGLLLNLDAWRKSSYPNTGTTWYDISGNGYNGTLTNDPVFGTACGGQITFDGVNDYVNLGTLGNFGSSLSSNSITMEFAFKSNYTAGIKQFGTINSGSSTLLAINFNRDENDNYSSGKTTFSLRDNNGLTLGVSMDTNIYTNSYFIVTISRNLSTNQVKFYVNGIPVSVTVGGTGFNSNPVTFSNFQYPFTIGASNNRGTIGNYLNSSIPFFRVYNKLLSDTEVLQNFNATKSRFGL